VDAEGAQVDRLWTAPGVVEVADTVPAMTPTRMTSIVLSTCLMTALAIGLAPAASAAELTVTDPARDNAGRGLDIVSAVVDNDDYVLTGTVSVSADRDGTLIVGLKAHDRGLVRVVSKHHEAGRSRSLLIDNDGRVTCDGLTVRWNAKARSATFSVPSTCLWDGNYGAVRPWFLTEGLDSGSDVDFATTDDFVARG